MKYLFYFLTVISIYAQDYINVTLSLLDNGSNIIKNETVPDSYSELNSTGSLIELRSKRYWNSSTKISFDNSVKPTIPLKTNKPKESFIDSDLFLVVVSSAVVFGATAAYFKLESDVAYEKYQKTDDKSYLDKTDRYDVYSGIALGALQINFGYLIYKFLTD